MKVLILVMSSEVGDYPKLVQKQKETWDSIKHPNVTTIYYYASSVTQLWDNRLDIQIDEGTGNYYKKTMEAFKEVLKLDWDYIFKTDNSAYINKKQLYTLLLSKPKGRYIGGHLYTPRYHAAMPFLWGEGFVLSRDVVSYLVSDYRICPLIRSGVEDVHISLILKPDYKWDTSLFITSFYPNKKVKYSQHIYRCKNDEPGAIKFEDELKAMSIIHDALYDVEINKISADK